MDSQSTDDNDSISCSLPCVEDGREFDARYLWHLDSGCGGLFLKVTGRASRAPLEDFAGCVEHQVHIATSRRMVIDLSACESMSSSAFGFVVRIFRYATVRDMQVLAVAPNDAIRGLMQVLGIDGFLLIVSDLDMAERFFEAQGI